MRIALLSTLARVSDGTPRALVKMGGRPLISWQIDLVKELGCEKLLCLAEGDEETAEVLQREASQSSMGIEMIGGPRHLLGKITADDELVVVADGLVMDPALAKEHLGSRRGVAAVSDYPAIEKGFERIDPETAWAGLLVARGSVGEQLAQMPADADTVSLLLRMALQSGTPVIALDELHLGTGEILLARNRTDFADREQALLDNSPSKVSWAGPAEKLASIFARKLAPDYFDRGPLVFLGFGALCACAGLASSWFGYLTAGLAVFSAGSFAISVSQALRHLRSRLRGRIPNRKFGMAINASVDGALVALLALAYWPGSLIALVFQPLLLVGLWRLVATLSAPRAGPFWRDRTVLSLIVMLISAMGILQPALPLIILALLGFALISEAWARLTQA